MVIKTSSTKINYACLYKGIYHSDFWGRDMTTPPDLFAWGLLEERRELMFSPNPVHEYIWKKDGMYATVCCPSHFKQSCISCWLPLPFHRHHTVWFCSPGHLSKPLERSGTKRTQTLKSAFRFCYPQLNSANTVFIRYRLCGKQQVWICLLLSPSNIYLMFSRASDGTRCTFTVQNSDQSLPHGG